MIQECPKHGEIVYKIYVAGEHVKITTDLSIEDKLFDDLNKGIFPYMIIPKKKQRECDPKLLADMEILSKVWKRLSHDFKLPLSGIDVIIDEATNDPVVIDINAFPSFKNFTAEEFTAQVNGQLEKL